MYSISSLLAFSLILLQFTSIVAFSRPIVRTNNEIKKRLMNKEDKRSLTIIEEANEMEAVISYIDCSMSEDLTLSELAMGIKGKTATACVAPPGMDSSSSSSPSSAISPVSIPAVIEIPTKPQTPTIISTVPAPISVPISVPVVPVVPIIPASVPVIVATTPIVPQPIVPQPIVVYNSPSPAATTPASIPAPASIGSVPAIDKPVIVSAQPYQVASVEIPISSPTPLAVIIAPPTPTLVQNPSPLLGPIPTAVSSDTCTSTDLDVCYEQKLALDAHNVARRAHHAPDLVWNDDLAKAALRWAEHCTWGHSGGQLFPPSFIYGENIFASSDPEPIVTMSQAITAYTNEETLYDYNNPVYSEAAGHFTQVVWVGTQEVGCAIINCDLDAFQKYGDTNSSYSVCVYSPSGNWNNQFTDNVLRP